MGGWLDVEVGLGPLNRSELRMVAACRILGLAVVLGLMPASPSPAARAQPECAGRTATIAGTNGHDELEGTSAKDVIAGGMGADTINGLEGNDLICGGPGRDHLTGGGSEGSDPWERLYGGPGIDTVYFAGAESGAFVHLRVRGPKRGGTFKSRGLGGARLITIENVRGTKFADALEGDIERNRLRGRRGPDKLEGGPGNDVLSGGRAEDEADGGDGKDACRRVEHARHCE